VSLDKDASSNPNLKAVHAGASMRKAQYLQPKASDIADAEVGYFAFSRLAAHIRVLSKSGEKPTLPAKRSFSWGPWSGSGASNDWRGAAQTALRQWARSTRGHPAYRGGHVAIGAHLTVEPGAVAA
jgi:hypothetical protein